MSGIRKCKFCGVESNTEVNHKTDDIIFDCPVCGEYAITMSCYEDYYSDKNSNKVSALIKESNIHEKVSYLFSNSDFSREDYNVVRVDEILNVFPNDLFDKIDRIIINLSKLVKSYGDTIKINSININDKSNNFFINLFFVEDLYNSSMYFFLINAMKERKIISAEASLPGNMSLTIDGWERVYKLRHKREEIDLNIIFIAMWFDPELKYIGDIIKESVEKSKHGKFEALRIDDYEHNNKIDDMIVAKINSSKFLIADFTGQRGGVYYEVGFAHGQGKQVIFTCKKDDMKNLHFDVRQYNVIDWKTKEELRERLINRINSMVL